MSLVSVPETPTWLCGCGFQGNHTPQRTADMVPRVTGTLRTQQWHPWWSCLPGPWGDHIGFYPGCPPSKTVNFLLTASLSVFLLSILPDGMHKGGTTLPGASMEAQAELGPLPCRYLSTPTCQYLRDRLGCLPWQSLSHL